MPLPELALYQPEIPHNTGTLIRLSACLGRPLHIIGPAAFRHDDRALARSGMDYRERASLVDHVDFAAFEDWLHENGRRLVLATTKASRSFVDFDFDLRDVILLGRESAGVPQEVHDRAKARITIPMQPGLRSLNLAISGAMMLSEALRQTQGFPACP